MVLFYLATVQENMPALISKSGLKGVVEIDLMSDFL